MPATSTRLAPRSATARSRVSNGSDLLPGIDGRSALARRYRDIAAAMVADAGGLDRLSEAKVQLIRRFAALAVQAEVREAQLANGADVDLGEQALISSTLVRLAQRIGVGRVAKEVPSLEQYLANLTGQVEAEG